MTPGETTSQSPDSPAPPWLMGSTNYVLVNATVVFAGTSVLSAGNTTITITVGACTSGSDLRPGAKRHRHDDDLRPRADAARRRRQRRGRIAQHRVPDLLGGPPCGAGASRALVGSKLVRVAGTLRERGAARVRERGSVLLEEVAERSRLHTIAERLKANALWFAQAALATALAWVLAREVLGHERPIFAPIVALIGVSANETEASFGHRGALLGGWRMHSGHDLVALCRIHDRIEGLEQPGIAEIGERVEPQPQTEVGRSDVEPVEARRRGDLVEVAEPLRRLDHREGEDDLVRPRDVLAPGAERAVHRPVASDPLGRVPAGSDECLRFGPRADHRADDASGPDVEHAHQLGRVVPANANQGSGARSLDGREDPGGIVRLGGAVLEVECHRVETGRRDRSRRRGTFQREPRVQRRSAARPRLSKPVGRHARILNGLALRPPP